MKCKNPHCEERNFVPVIEMDKNILIGIKCCNCGARYTENDLEIKINREEFGSSVRWDLTQR